MSTMEKEFEAVTNAGQTITLAGKTYTLQSPSLKVTFAVLKRMKVIFEIGNIKLDDFTKNTSSVEEIAAYLLKTIYALLFSDKMDEVLKNFSEIIAMLLANRTIENLRKTDLKPEEIENDIPLEEFMKIFVKVIEMSDMQNFLLTLIRMAQVQDMFQMLSQDSTGQS